MMDLIPIIEYTLLIFVGLLLLAIVTSYIIFILRKNKVQEMKSTAPVKQYIPSESEIQYLIPIRQEVNGYTQNSRINESKSTRKTTSRFTVLNASVTTSGVTQEREDSFDHRFSATKSKDAFAMFR